MEIADFDEIETAIRGQGDQGTPFSSGVNSSAAPWQILNRQMRSGEWIEINGLEVKGRIGVPETERENPQGLLVFLRFQIETTFAALDDQLEKTIDYADVAAEVEKVVETSGAQLIEKLVSDIGDALMACFPIQRRWIVWTGRR